MAWIAAHRKLLVFIAGAALTLAVQVWGTANPYVAFAILIATGLGIYQAPNVPAPKQAPGPALPPFRAGPGAAGQRVIADPPPSRPASMMQPVTFDDSLPDETPRKELP